MKQRLRNLQFSIFSFQSLFIVILLFPSISFSQSVAAFTDYRGYFQVFDKGIFQQIEYLPVKSFTVGGNAVAYIDNTNEFQIYYNGQKYHQVYAADAFNYFVSDNVVVYTVGSVATVFENGKTQKVSYFANKIFLSDSLVGYFDDSNYNLGVYYNSSPVELESSLLQAPQSVKVGSNTMAYVNQSGYFKIFYQGKIVDVDNTAPVTFATGRDVVAYIDGYNKYFHLFYRGQTGQVDINQPESFKVGFGVMAYLDFEGNFRVFSEGATRRLLSVKPDFYDVKGNMIIYGYNSEFRAFYGGQSVLIEDGIPTEYKLTNDGVAYIDVDNVLKFFYKGKSYTVSHETVNKYFVNNEVVWYQVGNNTWKVFYDGKNY